MYLRNDGAFALEILYAMEQALLEVEQALLLPWRGSGNRMQTFPFRIWPLVQLTGTLLCLSIVFDDERAHVVTVREWMRF